VAHDESDGHPRGGGDAADRHLSEDAPGAPVGETVDVEDEPARSET
jgi:hypothetical protein